MCGRFALDQELDDLIREFVVSENRFPEWHPSWNISPTSTIPIVIEREGGARELEPARWSLTPRWSKELSLKYPTFNARSETATEKPTFRESAKKHRCLIPASGYFEWVTNGATKTPYFISLANQHVFAFAGLYSWWTNPETGQVTATTTILTKDSTGSLSDLHDRMPVLVPPDAYDQWLDPGVLDGDRVISEMAFATDRLVQHYEHHIVNPLRGDGPHLIEAPGTETS